MKVYAVQWCDELDEWGAYTLDSRCYTAREDAEKRAERIRRDADWDLPRYAYVTELELVGGVR